MQQISGRPAYRNDGSAAVHDHRSVVKARRHTLLTVIILMSVVIFLRNLRQHGRAYSCTEPSKLKSFACLEASLIKLKQAHQHGGMLFLRAQEAHPFREQQVAVVPCARARAPGTAEGAAGFARGHCVAQQHPGQAAVAAVARPPCAASILYQGK